MGLSRNKVAVSEGAAGSPPFYGEWYPVITNRSYRGAESKKSLLFNFWGARRTDGITRGGVAQLGEHLPCKQGVMGSNPIISTKRTECERRDKREERRELLSRRTAEENTGS